MTVSPNITLVTGASGFVGQHLVKLLAAKGIAVRALYNSTPPTQELQLPNVTWQQADLLDIYDVEAAFEGVSDVYHCAGIVSFQKKDKDKVLHFNVTATEHVVNEALERNIRKLVHVSSVASLGRGQEQNKVVTEEEQWEESTYNSVYAMSKHQAEFEVWRGCAEGLNAVIINPGIILGEGNWEEGSAKLIKEAYNEFPFYTDGINAFVDVKDVVQAMYLLMHSDIQEERFIMSTGNIAYKKLFTLMGKALGKRPPHIHASPWLTELVWRWEWLKSLFTKESPTVTKETASTAQRKVNYDNSKLLEYLPDFQYTPIENTVERMAKAYLADMK